MHWPSLNAQIACEARLGRRLDRDRIQLYNAMCAISFFWRIAAAFRRMTNPAAAAWRRIWFG
jgi:hypothetical protein